MEYLTQVERFLALDSLTRELLLKVVVKQKKSYETTKIAYPCDVSAPTEKIIEVVCDQCRVTFLELTSETRLDSVVRARQMIFFLLRGNGFGLKQIGDMFNRDHSTVIYSCEKHLDRVMMDKYYAEDYKKIVEILKSA